MSIAPQPYDYDIIIVGAGVGGTACALALVHDRQLRVLLIERHAGPGNINRGESLLPPVTALLRRWGALERCYAAGARPVKTMQFFHFRKGLLLDFPLALPKVTDPYLVLPHPQIECAFVESAVATGRVEMRYATRVLSLIKEDGRVQGVLVQGSDGKEQRLNCRVVIGADGAKSVVRTGLGIDVYRAPYNHSLFIVDIDRPIGMPDVLRTEMHPDGGVLVVPGVNRLGLAAVIRSEHEHLFRSGAIEEKFSHIEHRSPLLTGRRPVAAGAHLYKLWRAHAPRYSAYGAVLLGDAIHVINPVMAQGMTMAIEDAAALARYLGTALEARATAAEIDTCFASYERERRPYNAGIIRNSHWLSLLFALGGPVGDILHRCAFAIATSPAGSFIQDRIWSSFATSPEPQYG
ncbi:MAG TPA: NAD(P)/FAD-dependent oxidoreductase [Burkholderiales bacterium]|nr:NAD(P)/FAD-dependent oxidoreductase [Burkholderiales bacterium]